MDSRAVRDFATNDLNSTVDSLQRTTATLDSSTCRVSTISDVRQAYARTLIRVSERARAPLVLRLS